jgi:fucose permease
MSTLAITIDWGALGQVALASLVFGIGIVTIFSFGITALSRREDGGSVAVHTAIAAACFVVCAAAVVYGLYLIIPQFH